MRLPPLPDPSREEGRRVLSPLRFESVPQGPSEEVEKGLEVEPTYTSTPARGEGKLGRWEVGRWFTLLYFDVQCRVNDRFF